MDEYLFIVLGKLRVDRIKLQRELQAEMASRTELSEGSPAERHTRRARWFNPDSEMAETG